MNRPALRPMTPAERASLHQATQRGQPLPLPVRPSAHPICDRVDMVSCAILGLAIAISAGTMGYAWLTYYIIHTL